MPASEAIFGRDTSPLLSSLAADWNLDETTGTRDDAAGSSDLTDNGGVASVTGKASNAAQFTSSSSQSLSHADSTALGTGNVDFTLAGWVYLGSISSDRVIVAKWNSASQRECLLQYTSGATAQFQFTVSSDSISAASVTASNAGTITTATWYFIVAWHDSVNNTLNIQVNNGTPNSLSYSSGVHSGTANFGLGGRQDSLPNYLTGRIDAMGLWKRVLTSGERTSLYNSGAGCHATRPFNTCPAGGRADQPGGPAG